MEREVPPTERQMDIVETPIPEKSPLGIVERKNLFRRRLPEISESNQFYRGPRKRAGRKTVAWSWAAALIDALILISVTCFMLLALSVTIKMQMQSVLSLYQNAFYSHGIFAEILLSFLYLVTTRTFLGFTIGEWACGLRLGDLKQRLQRFYALKVILRTMLVFATGILTLPVLSLLFGRDLPGMCVGLPLIETEFR